MMMFHLVTEDAFVELSIFLEKIEAALNCIIEEAACAHVQTLADIANDYLSIMRETMRVMQENKLTAPQ